MRIVIIDTDSAFTSGLSARCKTSGVQCEVFTKAATALAEMKKTPNSIDLVLLSRELADGQDGLSVAATLRKDAVLADIPYILMSSAWGKIDFAKHQKSPAGANAYYSKKSPAAELNATIDAVAGIKLSSTSIITNSPKSTSTQTTGFLDVKLYPASEILAGADHVTHTISTEIPIDLFLNGAPVAEAPKPTEPIESASAPIDLSVTEPAAPEIVISSSPTNTAATAPTDGDGGINISIANDSLEIEFSGPKESPAKPAPTSDVAQISTVLEQNGTPSSIDLGMTPMEEVPAVAAASTELPPDEATIVASAPPPIAAEIPSPVVEPEQPSEPSTPAVSEEEAARDLPYLFTGPSGGNTRSIVSPAPPVMVANIDMPIMGGPLSNDVETLKKYLMMREQDVSVLSAQLTYAKEELSKSENSIKRLTLENEDFFHQVNDLKKRVSVQEHELQHAGKSMEGEVEQLRLEVKSKIDRIKFLEDRLNDSAEQYEKLKERVRLDIRKIRVREKELESKLEILKKDSETLISARENKILELKRKIDLLEFNYDTLQDKNEMERQNVLKGKEKIEKVQKVIKLALGVIEAEDEDTSPGPPNTDPGIKAA